MYSYRNEQFLVAGDTIVLAHGNGILTIPEELEPNHKIHKIGVAALQGSDYQNVIIPETVKEIGRKAFFNCSFLKKITLPNPDIKIGIDAFEGHQISEITIYLSGKQAADLENISLLLGDGSRLLNGIYLSQNILLKLGSAFRCRPAIIPAGISRIFCVSPIQGRQNIFREIDCLDTKSSRREMSEDEAFLELIKYGDPVIYKDEDERKSDWIYRDEKKHEPQRTCLFVFRSQDSSENGKVKVVFQLLHGLFFYQTSRKIRYKGNEYYLYQRNFLSQVPFANQTEMTIPYREDIAIYDKDGLITKKKLSEEVYAKYKLASIL